MQINSNSQSSYKWILAEKPSADFLSKFPEYPLVVAGLLFERGLNTEQKIGDFFGKEYENGFSNPFLLSGINETCQRIFRAVGNKEKIVIYSDYDVDGVCSSTILGEFFKWINYPFNVYIPDRQKEGHGLNQKAMELLASEGAKLIITVDCGTTNINEINWAVTQGVDTIVIDHHQVVGQNPPAVAFVNPHQNGDEYPFKDLCGTALAFKVFLALKDFYLRSNKLSMPKTTVAPLPLAVFSKKGSEKWLLDLVSMATVADMMPLLGENRIFVKYGLIVLARTRRRGLKKLMEVSGIKARYDLETLSTNLDTAALGFAIGPRLNAASRMAHGNLAYEILNSADESKISELAECLNENNRRRQQVTEKIIKDVDKIVSSYPVPPRFIVEGSSDWSLTLVGLAASRINEKYHRPVFLFQILDNVCRGSLRGVEGFNVIESLDYISAHLVQYGGHPAAAGATFKISKKDIVSSLLNKFAQKKLTSDLLANKLLISAEISLDFVDWDLIDWIKKFEPFGMGNSKPKFVSRKVEITGLSFLGRNSEHLKFFVKSPGTPQKTIPVLWFRHGGSGGDLKNGDILDIVYETDVNEWNGNREIQLKLIDYVRN